MLLAASVQSEHQIRTTSLLATTGWTSGASPLDPNDRYAGALRVVALGGEGWCRVRAPELLAAVNVMLGARAAAGLSVELVDCSVARVHDDRVKVRFTLDDGDTFEVDSAEMASMVRAINTH